MSGLVLQSSTAEWLVSLGCLDRGSLCPLNGAGKGGSVVLDEAASARFEAGAVRRLALVDFLPTKHRRLLRRRVSRRARTAHQPRAGQL